VHEHLAHHAGTDSGIPRYGYTNEAEFFAVVSEYFFQSPAELAARDPELYGLLERIFRQDLLNRRL
jgi:Mlc titration factor MtfA (ptsG expression regulator)